MITLDDTRTEYLSQVFKDIDLSYEEIHCIEFDGCTFRECNFSETDLKKSRFIDCHFEQCNLSNARIELCRFSETSFHECKMVGIDWTRANWPGLSLPSAIKFYKCILNDSSFYGLDLEELVMQECKAHDVDFREGNFSHADFRHTDFTNSLFIATNLSNSNFTEALNYNIDINLNQIQGAKFSRYEAINLLYSLGIELVD